MPSYGTTFHKIQLLIHDVSVAHDMTELNSTLVVQICEERGEWESLPPDSLR